MESSNGVRGSDVATNQCRRVGEVGKGGGSLAAALVVCWRRFLSWDWRQLAVPICWQRRGGGGTEDGDGGVINSRARRDVTWHVL